MVEMPTSYNTATVLSEAFDGALNSLGTFVASSSFTSTVTTAFGEQVDPEAVADMLYGMIIEHRLPAIQLVPSDVLRGGNAAFDSGNDVIYVNNDFVAAHADSPQTVQRVLLEELGHYIDANVNAVDAPGDEGAIFASLVSGDQLSAGALSALKAEDDHGTIVIDSHTVGVEFSAQYGNITLDGNLADWTTADRLEVPGSDVPGYELYGKYTGDAFVFALKSDTAAIGANTTFWLNTDQNTSTGYQIWGFAGGAEYNVNFDATGTPNLYTGAAGETLVNASLDHAYSTDGTMVEFAVPTALLAGTPQATDVLVDVNDQVFLPTDYSTYTYTVAAPQPDPTPVAVGDITLDGNLADWTTADRLEVPGSGVAGYELYGKVTGDNFVFALKSDTTQISAGTTFWLNTDQNTSTGYQIWGFAGGDEYNVNFDGAGIPHLYTGAAGETLADGALPYYFSADHQTVEFAVPIADLAGAPQAADVLVDVNNQVFLPTDYSSYTYTVAAPQSPPPATVVGDVTLNGDLTDWTSANRLELPGTGVAGYELYGKYTGDSYVFALNADSTEIGANTTFWLNTDQNTSTGYQIWGSAGGAEYNVNFDASGIPHLYTGAAGETLVDGALAYAFSADHKTVEFAVPNSDLAGAPKAVDVLVDVNDQVFLPTDYTSASYTVEDTSALPPRVDDGTNVAIVYSDTTAAQFYDPTAYAQLFMSVQNQATMAGVPFDVLTENDLTDLSKLVNYETIIFPSFTDVPTDKLAAIESNLKTAVYDYGIGLITAGDFMTNDATGAPLAGDPYARMKTLLDLTRVGGGTGDVSVHASDVTHPAMDGYQPDELIRDYTNVGYSYYDSVGNPADVLVDQQVNGQTYNAVLATETGGRNVHYSSPAMLADNNLLWQGIQWTAEGDGPSVGLQISRQSSIVASRTDMDQSQETYDVSPDTGPGIYDELLPIVQGWKDAYNFVGSYYINIGNNPPDQTTDWSVSGPYYQQLLALGNEIGTHSYTHPDDTNLLSAAQIEFEFNQSKQIIEQQLGIQVDGAAVPGAPETLATAQDISQYFNYISGGYSAVGAGYPGAFGYLTPGDTNHVYLAPNMKFDFTLVDFENMTPAQAEAAWAQEFASLTSHADVPVVLWPWHDYGPTQWIVDQGVPSHYTEQMYTDFIAQAYNAGAEFVTLDDLAQRIVSFEQSGISFTTSGNVLTATVASSDAGKFALDLDHGYHIQSVDNWYAYDQDSVFLPKTGGQYTINLGDTPTDVTHIVSLPSRAELLSVTGDGTNLSFSAMGEGHVVIDLTDPAGQDVQVTGASVVSLVNDRLELGLTGMGEHDVSVTVGGVAVNTDPTITSDGGGDTASVAIDENQTAVTTVTAVDPDVGSVLDYGIAGGADAALFAIDSQSGALSFVTAPDFEAPADAGADNVYDVTVQVADGQGGIDTQAIAVTVKDVLGVTLVGDGSANTLTGTPESDTLNGGSNSDTLYGLGGNDTLLGGSGRDTLYGGNGNDRLDGGSGGDTLVGGPGADTLTGGSGGDRFVYQSVDDSNALQGSDLLTDFKPGKDTIDLAAIDANTTAAGDQAFQLLPQGADFTGPGQLRVTQDAANNVTTIEGNVDADPAPDLRIEISGIVDVTEHDFAA